MTNIKKTENRRITIFFFMKLSRYLSPLLPYSVNTNSYYDLRNTNDLQSVVSRTNQFY